MPTIPTYQRQKQNNINANAPKQSIDTPAAAFGGNTGRALEQAGNQLGQLSDLMVQRQLELRDKANRAWANEKLTELTEWADDYGYNPETGAYQKKGQAVDGLFKQAAQDYDKRIAELAATAPNTDAGRRLKEKAHEVRRSDVRGYARHQAAELTQWEISASESMVAATTNWIHRNWSFDAKKLEEKFDNEILPEVERTAELKGVAPAAAIERARANAFAPVIKQHIAKGATEKAGALLKRWDSSLNKDQRIALTAAIRRKEIEMKADNQAMNLVAEGLPWDQAQKRINQIKDQDEKRATRTMYNIYRTAKVQSDNELAQRMSVDAVDRIHTLKGDVAAQQKYYDAMPEDTKPERAAKKEAERALQNYKAAGGMDFLTDPKAWEKCEQDLRFARITTEQELRAKYGALFTKADMEERVRDQKDRQNFVDFASAADAAFRSAIGKVNKDLSDSDLRAKKAFTIHAKQMAQETNRANDTTYLQQLADRFVLDGEVSGRFSPGHGPDKKLYEAMSNPTWVPDIIDDDDRTSKFQLTKSAVKMIKKRFPTDEPTRWDVAMTWADNDPELAARYIWREYIKGKVGRLKE